MYTAIQQDLENCYDNISWQFSNLKGRKVYEHTK